MDRHAANAITLARIFGSAGLLAAPLYSTLFWGLYLLCGISDLLDGFVARRTGSISPFGAKLDSAADLVFAVAVLVRLLPTLSLPVWLWVWVGAVAAMRIAVLTAGACIGRRFVSLHTLPNKAAGLLAFLFPLTLPLVEAVWSAAAVCAVASAAAVYDGVCLAAGRTEML